MTVNRQIARVICRDDLSKIENYDRALADKNFAWPCHHRLELTLDGENAHTAQELERLGMYRNRPYYELIFLPQDLHGRIHKAKGIKRVKCLQKITEEYTKNGFL